MTLSEALIALNLTKDEKGAMQDCHATSQYLWLQI